MTFVVHGVDVIVVAVVLPLLLLLIHSTHIPLPCTDSLVRPCLSSFLVAIE